MKYNINYVQFKDSHHSMDGWGHHEEQLDELGDHVVEAVGFVLEDTEDWLMLGQATSGEHSLGRLMIPKRAVVERYTLFVSDGRSVVDNG